MAFYEKAKKECCGDDVDVKRRGRGATRARKTKNSSFKEHHDEGKEAEWNFLYRKTNNDLTLSEREKENERVRASLEKLNCYLGYQTVAASKQEASLIARQ